MVDSARRAVGGGGLFGHTDSCADGYSNCSPDRCADNCASCFQFQRHFKRHALPDEISVAEAAAKRDAGAFILDVRTQEEWNDYHIPGSTLIPLDQLETRVNEVPQGKEVVVVCRSGNRSKPGRDALKAAGYTQVTSMSGGLKEWRDAGYPTVTGP